MDYPHPQIDFKGDQMDFSHAYDTKIGDWDKVSVDYAYGDHKTTAELNQVIDNAYAKGLRLSPTPMHVTRVGHISMPTFGTMEKQL
jgi:hypothetical protein